ncbi:MAG: ketoacyl-ACP synthase III [Clostridiales bacterium]|jgi:3-oxoacyl-[acyl-carrier-protein] synthase-3|nr:ketoacyl-ACP synthase III [Clostridiales bacterium]
MKILGTGAGLPARRVYNSELAAFLDTSDEWIVSHTGIQTRYVCVEESLTDLAEAAGRQALRNAGWTAKDMDLLIAATISGDYITPSLACRVAERLGAVCPAFDVNAACSGFIYALEAADAFMAAGKAENILILACEEMSKHVDWTDRSICPLFGDGAGAVAVSCGGALRYMHLTAAGNTAPLKMRAPRGNSPFQPDVPQEDKFIRMSGQEVFKFAVQSIEKEVGLALAALSLAPEDVHLYLLHQANLRIIESARQKLKLSADKFPTNIERHGNMSSAAIPILLNEMLEAGKVAEGDILLMSAFGAGMTTGTCVWYWES